MLAVAQAHANTQHEQLEQHRRQLTTPTKPPRGYCAPISRAIPNKSRCYEHLVLADGKTRHAPAAASRPAGGSEVKGGELDEELVYVRLETSGSSLADLNTRAINERLLLGVFDALLNNSTTTTTSTSAAGSPEIRAQILDEVGVAGASKCRSAIERLVCRLVYPSCHFRRSDISALVRPPCREDCFLARDLFCSNLNWSQFAQELRRAFNSTLVAAIKWPLQLELLQPAPSSFAQTFQSSPSSQSSSSEKATSEDLDPQPPPSPFDTRLGRQSGDVSTLHGDEKSVSVLPIHFYWPHEHSLESCERLPPLRPILSSAWRHQKLSWQADHDSRYTANLSQVGASGEGSNRAAAVGRPRRLRRNLARVWPVCSSAHLTAAFAAPKSGQPLGQTRPEAAKIECLANPDGIDYRGSENRTGLGLECQHWTSQKPHKHSSSELLFDNMREARNYCRNPGGLELKPWCYTLDPNVRWQYCDIKPCPK